LVAGVSLELDALHPAALERVLEKEQLRLDVRSAPPGRPPEPGPADLHPTVLRRGTQVASRALRLPARADGERHLRPSGERVADVPVEVARPGHVPEDLQVRISGRPQPLPVLLFQPL